MLPLQRKTPPMPPRPKRAAIPVFAGHVEKRTIDMPLPPQPEAPAPYDDADVAAWKALYRGDATAEQQQRCVDHLFFMCGHNDKAFAPGDPHGTSYLAGKRSISVQVGRYLHMRSKGQPDTEQG